MSKFKQELGAELKKIRLQKHKEFMVSGERKENLKNNDRTEKYSGTYFFLNGSPGHQRNAIEKGDNYTIDSFIKYLEILFGKDYDKTLVQDMIESMKGSSEKYTPVRPEERLAVDDWIIKYNPQNWLTSILTSVRDSTGERRFMYMDQVSHLRFTAIPGVGEQAWDKYLKILEEIGKNGSKEVMK